MKGDAGTADRTFQRALPQSGRSDSNYSRNMGMGALGFLGRLACRHFASGPGRRHADPFVGVRGILSLPYCGKRGLRNVGPDEERALQELILNKTP